jgi:hypothetical protein
VSIVDVVGGGLSLEVGKVELLSNSVVLVNIFCSFDLHIKLVAIQGVGDGVSKVLNLLDPGDISATQLETCRLSWFLYRL